MKKNDNKNDINNSNNLSKSQTLSYSKQCESCDLISSKRLYPIRVSKFNT